MNTRERDCIGAKLRKEQYEEVAKMCLHGLKAAPVDDKPWLLKYLGIAKIRLGEVVEGISTAIEALDLSTEPDVALWSALGDAFEKIQQRACAGQCYRLAAVTDVVQPRHWERKAQECERSATSPEDIAASQVFLPAKGRPSICESVRQAKADIDTLIYAGRWAGPKATFLHILRGNSSFTPILKGRGGGYLLMHRGKGCVIDPGHGFIRNFLEQGYGFGDIHAIVVTHGHDDHVMDLPAIASVLHKAKFNRKVDLYLDETSYRAFAGHYLLASSGLRLQPILKAGQQREVFRDNECAVTMHVHRAEHMVPLLTPGGRPSARKMKTGYGAGLEFRLGYPGGHAQYLLVPSDTGWSAKVARQYQPRRGCDAALLHISSIESDVEWRRHSKRGEPSLLSHHMGLQGVIRFIETVEPRLVLLSEKGAELDAVWHRIADVVRAAFRHREVVVCATDIGTKVTFDGKGSNVTGGYLA